MISVSVWCSLRAERLAGWMYLGELAAGPPSLVLNTVLGIAKLFSYSSTYVLK